MGQKGTIKTKVPGSTTWVVQTNQEHTIKGDAITYCKTTNTSIWYGINQGQYGFISYKLSSNTSNITMSMVSECTSFDIKSPWTTLLQDWILAPHYVSSYMHSFYSYRATIHSHALALLWYPCTHWQIHIQGWIRNRWGGEGVKHDKQFKELQKKSQKHCYWHSGKFTTKFLPS